MPFIFETKLEIKSSEEATEYLKEKEVGYCIYRQNSNNTKSISYVIPFGNLLTRQYRNTKGEKGDIIHKRLSIESNAQNNTEALAKQYFLNITEFLRANNIKKDEPIHYYDPLPESFSNGGLKPEVTNDHYQLFPFEEGRNRSQSESQKSSLFHAPSNQQSQERRKSLTARVLKHFKF